MSILYAFSGFIFVIVVMGIAKLIALPFERMRKKADEAELLFLSNAFKDEAVDDISVWGFFTDIGDLTEAGTIQERLVPLTKYARFVSDPSLRTVSLKPISIDDQKYRVGKVFAKPDAVFRDQASLKKIVVEIKSNKIGGVDCFKHGSIPSKHLLQLLISAWAFAAETGEQHDNVVPILRYLDCLVVPALTADLTEKFSFYAALLSAVKFKQSSGQEDTISASELARFITVMDNAYKADLDDKAQLASLKGELVHLMAFHGKNANALIRAIQQGKFLFDKNALQKV